MAAWTGWEDDLLTALGDPHTAANKRFLGEWHSSRNFPCANNPVFATVQTRGWQQCLRGLNYAYAQQADGLHATTTELNQAPFAAIKAALKSGDPFTVNNPSKVAAALLAWGSPEFSQAYASLTAGGAGGGKPKDAQLLGGWRSLQHSVGHHMRVSLHSGEKSRRAALRALARAHKVKI